VVADFLEHITIIGQLHDNTQTLGLIIYKCLLILDNIRMSNRSQYPNFINGIISFLLAQVVHLYFFQSVVLAVFQSFDLINIGVCTVTLNKSKN